MKNCTIFIIAFLSFYVPATAQTVEQTQRALVCKMTATWCQYCGAWGATNWEAVVT